MKKTVLTLLCLGFFSSPLLAATRAQLQDYQILKETAFSPEHTLGERWAALQSMGKEDFQISKGDLIAALQSKEWFVRNAALLALPKTHRTFVREWSERLLFDKALVVRTQAIKNLIEIKAQESWPEIFRALNHKMNFHGNYSLWIRPYLAKALALYPPKDWKNVYRKMLTDKDPQVQVWAVIGLEEKSGLHLGDKKDSMESKRMKWLNYFKS
jgi:HEAT repeat protein